MRRSGWGTIMRLLSTKVLEKDSASCHGGNRHKLSPCHQSLWSISFFMYIFNKVWGFKNEALNKCSVYKCFFEYSILKLFPVFLCICSMEYKISLRMYHFISPFPIFSLLLFLGFIFFENPFSIMNGKSHF